MLQPQGKNNLTTLSVFLDCELYRLSWGRNYEKLVNSGYLVVIEGSGSSEV